MPTPEAGPSVASAKSPIVSVVVPNFNHARYLPRCLTAILEQSVQPLEIIIIDDASTDNSVQVAEEFARRNPIIRVQCNEKNRGVVVNVDRALRELIRGDYVLFAAADDELMPGFMEKSVGLLRRHPQAALSCTIGDWHELEPGDSGKTRLSWHVGVGMGTEPCFLTPARIAELEGQGRVFIASHSAIFRKAALLEAGGFKPELRWHCDWFAFTVASFRHGVCFVPEPLSRQYIYATSYSAEGRKKKKREHREVLQRILNLLMTPEYQDVEPMIRKSGAMFHFGGPMLRLMLCNRAYRRFLTPAFLRKNLSHIVKLEAKRFMPAFLANWYFHLAGYRASAPKNSKIGAKP